MHRLPNNNLKDDFQGWSADWEQEFTFRLVYQTEKQVTFDLTD